MNLHSAAKQGNVAKVARFLDHGVDVDAGDEAQFKALHWAARNNHLPVVQHLLSRSANVNAINDGGDTALHNAVQSGHANVVTTLLRSGAAVNLANKHGATALHYACFWRHAAIAVQLVSFGANIHLTNRYNQSPLALAGPALASQLQEAAAAYVDRQRSPSTPAVINSAAAAEARVAVEDLLQEVLTPATPASPPTTLGQREWEISPSEVTYGAFLARGAFGEVYRGEWRGTEVAIKQVLQDKLTPKAMREFHEEVEVMARLRHPNINLFMAACVDPNETMFLLTEYEARGSLYSVLHDPKVDINWKLLIRMAKDTARGMAYLHGHKPPIVHRDLKSLNLLVDEHWNVKITDFGLTTVKPALDTQCGTPQWMAPEILRNDTYSHLIDVYAFGIILWEMATRQIPYHGMNTMQVGMKVLLEGLRPEIPSYVPTKFAELMRRCWAADPNDRPDFPAVLKHLRACT